jgi:2-dehydro-3-deoxyphosphogluconate aldolase/(4S)-4-hydroxy-2-oxoglutarate aldolase
MNAIEVKNLIKREKFVPILRIDSADLLFNIAKAVSDAGAKIFEFTMTIPGMIDIVPKIKSEFPELTLGLGTVFNPEDAKNAIKNGIDFIVSPVLKLDLADTVKSEDKLLMLAGFTPSEIYEAHKAGSDIVKLFPAMCMNPRFVKDIKGPMPFIDLLPTGGLELDSGTEFIKAGAVAVGLGGNIFDKQAIKDGNFDIITKNVSEIIAHFKEI